MSRTEAPPKWNAIPLAELVPEEHPICYGVLKPGPANPGGVPLIRIVDLTGDRVADNGLHRISPALDAAFRRSRLRGGEILLSIQGTIGRVAIAPRELRGANISRTIARIDVGERINAGFLRHWLLSASGQRALEDAVTGTTRDSLNIGALRLIQVPVPPPPEQRRIAEILDTVDAALRSTEKLIAKLRRLKQGVLHDLLTRGVDRANHLRDPADSAARFVATEAGYLPGDWRAMRIGDFAQVRRGASPRPINSPLWFSDDGPGWVRINDVTASTKYLRSTTQRLSPAGAARSVRVGPGDVIMSIAATVGEAIIVDMDACIHDGFVVVDQDRDQVTSEFLCMALALRKPAFVAQGQTGTQANINSAIVRATAVAVPPVAEQLRITAIADKQDYAIAASVREVDKLRLIKRGLATALFADGERAGSSREAMR
jgi:type I restriction enzyme S subunit